MVLFLVVTLLFAGAAAQNLSAPNWPLGPYPGPGPNSLSRTPPMGWMSWQVFRCETECDKHPTACINQELYAEMADAMANEYKEAGYETVSIDDCWEDVKGRMDGKLVPDMKRFPDGMKALGDHMHSKGIKFGIYSDEGTRTCGGFPGSQGYEKADAETFAAWGVDYLKLDGCYNNQSGFVAGYPAMGAALQATGRHIVYSCSWPAYLGGNETSKPFEAMIAAGCNSWRNWEDIQCAWGTLTEIIEHWGLYGSILQQTAGPGHWHDPDMLLIGNGCISFAEEQTQMALWSVLAAPLIMGNDLRNVPAASKAILLNKEAIRINQDALGKMGKRLKVGSSTQLWVRDLEGGDVAVALYNKNGGAPAGITLVAEGKFCPNGIGVHNDSTSFGYSLESCSAAVVANPRCKSGHGFFFLFGEL